MLTIIIVSWNSQKFLPHCLESIYSQTFKDFSVIIIDNGSTDGSIEFIKKNYPQAILLKNPKNLGFARANNQGLKLARGEYVLLCNTDIVLEKNFLDKIIETIKKDQNIASVGGKLLKAEWRQEELPTPQKTAIIDSRGIALKKSHQIIEIGANEPDQKLNVSETEVFGISGALVLYRRSALEAIKYQDEYFDENFFSYKEDVDLSWRLRLAGYTARVNQTAIAYHFRSISWDKARSLRSKFFNQLSYKNHFLTVIKNQTLKNLLIFSPHILWFEFKKIIYILFFEPATLFGLFLLIKQLPATLKKRKDIMSKHQINSKKISQWFK